MKYVLAVVVAFQIFFFQNCANNNFNKAVESGSLVEKSGTDDESDTVEGEIPVTETGGTTGTGGTLGTNGTTGTVACERPGNGNGKAPCPAPPQLPVPPIPGETLDDGAGLYVCVLAGAGHSVKLAYQSDSLNGKVATPDDVCMSAKACTDIVSQYFRVKMPARRGFCPNKNPHVHYFTDAQIQNMINVLKSK